MSRFQSAVAHELFSDGLKSDVCRQWGKSFKALSRMSSSPTVVALQFDSVFASRFQSAVAHELFSDCGECAREPALCCSFKALSRMSSSPTGDEELLHAVRWYFVSKRCRA